MMTKYSDEFRDESVRPVLESERTVAEAAKGAHQNREVQCKASKIVVPPEQVTRERKATIVPVGGIKLPE